MERTKAPLDQVYLIFPFTESLKSSPSAPPLVSSRYPSQASVLAMISTSLLLGLALESKTDVSGQASATKSYIAYDVEVNLEPVSKMPPSQLFGCNLHDQLLGVQSDRYSARCCSPPPPLP